MEEYYVIGNIPVSAEASVECPPECAFAEFCWGILEEVPVPFRWLCLTDTFETEISNMPAEVWSIKKIIRRNLQIVDQHTFVTG